MQERDQGLEAGRQTVRTIVLRNAMGVDICYVVQADARTVDRLPHIAQSTPRGCLNPPVSLLHLLLLRLLPLHHIVVVVTGVFLFPSGTSFGHELREEVSDALFANLSVCARSPPPFVLNVVVVRCVAAAFATTLRYAVGSNPRLL
jgi:hypothetical protein